jgi:hypothetical protein
MLPGFWTRIMKPDNLKSGDVLKAFDVDLPKVPGSQNPYSQWCTHCLNLECYDLSLKSTNPNMITRITNTVAIRIVNRIFLQNLVIASSNCGCLSITNCIRSFEKISAVPNSTLLRIKIL